MTLSTTPNYPTSLDTLPNPTSTDNMDDTNIEHDLLHQLEGTILERLEAKVGADSSAVNTSHDYKLSGVTGSDKAASLTGSETLTNKQLTAPKINEAVNLTSTSTELNILDGATLSTAELNILDGVTATAAELNITNYGDTTYKVLNVQPKCKAYRNGAQSINSGAATKVQLNAEVYDNGTNFDSATNYRFNVPVTGWYMILASIQIDNMTADKRVISYIYVNGSGVAEASAHASYTQDISSFVSSIEYLASGQYVELYAYQDSGSAKNLIGNTISQSFLCVHLLSV